MIGLQGRRGQGGRAECSKEQMSGMSFLINHKHDFPRVKLEIVLYVVSILNLIMLRLHLET